MEEPRPEDEQRQHPLVHEPLEDVPPPTDSNEIADERATIEEPSGSSESTEEDE